MISHKLTASATVSVSCTMALLPSERPICSLTKLLQISSALNETVLLLVWLNTDLSQPPQVGFAFFFSLPQPSPVSSSGSQHCDALWESFSSLSAPLPFKVVDQGPVSWRLTTVKWQQFSQFNRHSTIGTQQTEYHEAVYHCRRMRWGVTACSPTMVTLHDTWFVKCQWWNDGWTVKTVVTWQSLASMIPAPERITAPVSRAQHTQICHLPQFFFLSGDTLRRQCLCVPQRP